MVVGGLPAGGLTWEGLNVSYGCPNNTMTDSGETEFILSFNGSHWTEMDPEFICLETCPTDPFTPTTNMAVNNYTGVPVVGMVVEYYCAGGRFVDTETSYISVCNGTHWNVSIIFLRGQYDNSD
ncbi:hypothetical protein SK128_022462 [Halocaridina rubra]|uniref:Sushi domain-containing protein n=1 Tax=Halocaridina rubra TaxID=373956 RepID=A0AAN8WID4_HALRR